MNLIHIADKQGHKQSYESQDARRLWSEGIIPRDSLYWQEGMTEWRSVEEYFATAGTPTGLDVPPRSTPDQPLVGFVKNPLRLTRFLIAMLWAYLAVAGLAALISCISLATGEASKAETEALSHFDMGYLLIGLLQLLITLITGIAFLKWIHRANRNARGLGAHDMTFTPGWSVGWYFVPIANLWKPYQAMKEIWQASANPTSRSSQNPPAFLSTWWTLWVVSNFLSKMSFRSSMRANTGSELIASEVITLISDLIDIPLCLVAIRLVREIIRLQTHWASQVVQSSCGICRQPASPSDLIRLNDTWVCAQCKPAVLQQIRERGFQS